MRKLENRNKSFSSRSQIDTKGDGNFVRVEFGCCMKSLVCSRERRRVCVTLTMVFISWHSDWSRCFSAAESQWHNSVTCSLAMFAFRQVVLNIASFGAGIDLWGSRQVLTYNRLASWTGNLHRLFRFGLRAPWHLLELSLASARSSYIHEAFSVHHIVHLSGAQVSFKNLAQTMGLWSWWVSTVRYNSGDLVMIRD